MAQQQDWGTDWTARIGQVILELRKARGMSAQDLADRCSELGYPIPRSTIANMETRARKTVPVQEIAVLAAALGVPPVRLLFDLRAGDAELEVTPGAMGLPIEAIGWFSGQRDEVVTAARMERQHRRQAVRAHRAIPELEQLAAEAEQELMALGESTPEEVELLKDKRIRDVSMKRASLNFGLKYLGQSRRDLVELGMTPPPIDEEIVELYREHMAKDGFEAV